MRKIALAAATALLLAVGSAFAAPISTAPGLETGTPSVLQLIQAKKKSETVGQKIKRVWRSWTDYQFCARCPVIIPLTASTCSVSRAKSRDEARATCVARNPLCYVNEGAC